jgi:hypothetical protein
MTKGKLATLHIIVLPTDETLEQDQLNEFSRELYQELKESKADEVKMVPADSSPRGAKGIPAFVEIAVAFVAPFAPDIFKLIRRWVKLSPERKVKLISTVSGKEVEVVISSDDLKTEDINKIVASLLASFG